MFKKILLVTGLVVIIGLLIFGAVNRTLAKNENESLGQGSNGRSNEAWSVSGATSEDENQGRRGGKGGQGGNSQNGQGELADLPPAQPGELSAAEAEALLYMREEEKLAHDVYVTLYEQWGLNTFQNIASSEQAHTDAVKALLDRYGLDDPASAQVGVFTNPDLQVLYDQLIARGGQSLAEAIKTGGAIEEIDILDLEERLAQTDNADIQQVFNSLLNGSKNHLRAFASVLQVRTGETYQPQYLSAEAYQSILGGANAGNSRGGNSQGGNTGGGNGRGGQGGQQGGGGRGQGGQGRGGSRAQP
jgi:hypothetical protein